MYSHRTCKCTQSQAGTIPPVPRGWRLRLLSRIKRYSTAITRHRPSSSCLVIPNGLCRQNQYSNDTLRAGAMLCIDDLNARWCVTECISITHAERNSVNQQMLPLCVRSRRLTLFARSPSVQNHGSGQGSFRFNGPMRHVHISLLPRIFPFLLFQRINTATKYTPRRQCATFLCGRLLEKIVILYSHILLFHQCQVVSSSSCKWICLNCFARLTLITCRFMNSWPENGHIEEAGHISDNVKHAIPIVSLIN